MLNIVQLIGFGAVTAADPTYYDSRFFVFVYVKLEMDAARPTPPPMGFVLVLVVFDFIFFIPQKLHFFPVCR